MKQSNFNRNVRLLIAFKEWGIRSFSATLSFSYNQKKKRKRFFSCNLLEELCFSIVVCSIFKSSLVTFGRKCGIVPSKSNVIIAKKDKTLKIWLDIRFIRKKIEQILSVICHTGELKKEKNRIQWPDRVMLIFFSLFQSNLKTHKSKFNTQSHKSYFFCC